MTTEIYCCKDGQALKEGKLEMSSSITTKDEAASDALSRCRRDPTLKRIAYYKVSSDGEFRVFYSYTNPNCKPAGRPKTSGVQGARKPTRKSPPPAPKGFFARLKKSLGF